MLIDRTAHADAWQQLSAQVQAVMPDVAQMRACALFFLGQRAVGDLFGAFWLVSGCLVCPTPAIAAWPHPQHLPRCIAVLPGQCTKAPVHERVLG